MPRLDKNQMQQVYDLCKAVDDILNTEDFRVSEGVGYLLAAFEGLGEQLKKQVAENKQEEDLERNLYAHWAMHCAKMVERFFRLNPEATTTCSRTDIASKICLRFELRGDWMDYLWGDIILNYYEIEGDQGSPEFCDFSDHVAYLSENL